MRYRLLHIVRQPAGILILLPVFFIVHIMVANPELFHFITALKLSGMYIIGGLIITTLIKRWFRSWAKAALFCFALLCFEYFFAALYDSLQTTFHGYFFSRYRFLLSLLVVLLFLTGRWIRKSSHDLSGIFLYLNLLFILLISFDLFNFAFWSERNVRPGLAEEVSLTPVRGDKPDIYLIVADGYPGKTALTGYFRYTDNRFSDSLRSLGFYVNDSAASNYNFTAHSMASLLNFSYLKGNRQNGTDLQEVIGCVDLINNNRFTRFLSDNGYTIVNHSIFPLNGTEAALKPDFLPTSSTIITRQTFSGRFLRYLVFQLAHTYKVKKLIRYFHGPVLKGNQALPEKTILIAKEKSASPRFVYTHLIMPHYPYTHDSSGTETDEYRWKDVRDSVLFKGYLKYTNSQLLTLIRSIQLEADRMPIIILIGDHGFREFNKTVYNPLQFSCLQAVYYPAPFTRGNYQNMSHVNLLRTLLNDQFNQQLPLLKDSSFFLTDPVSGHH